MLRQSTENASQSIFISFFSDFLAFQCCCDNCRNKKKTGTRLELKTEMATGFWFGLASCGVCNGPPQHIILVTLYALR